MQENTLKTPENMDPVDVTGAAPSKTAKTENFYSKKCNELRETARRETGDEKISRGNFIDWYCTQDNRWASGALSVYRNAIRQRLDEDPSWVQYSSALEDIVRRQGFWDRLLLSLSERLAHLLFGFRRLDCGIANAAV